MAETSLTGATLRMAETIPPRSLSERYKKRPPEDDREPEDEVEADAGLTPAVNTASRQTPCRQRPNGCRLPRHIEIATGLRLKAIASNTKRNHAVRIRRTFAPGVPRLS